MKLSRRQFVRLVAGAAGLAYAFNASFGEGRAVGVELVFEGGAADVGDKDVHF